jgi:hypothetical protein
VNYLRMLQAEEISLEVVKARVQRHFKLLARFHLLGDDPALGAAVSLHQIRSLAGRGAVSRDEIDIRELEGLIKTEASVLYRLLRYLNSTIFGMRNEIHSIRHALAILGEREIRRWIRLVALVSAGQEKTSDLVL